MVQEIKESLWRQFGASIDMLHNAIKSWPEEKWEKKTRFFYVAYHTIVFLDYYLTFPAQDFAPKLPYKITEDWHKIDGAIDDLIPASNYNKEELLNYLQVCRDKCHGLIASLDDKKVNERWIDESGKMNYPIVEILFYNMRHVQHHAAQLNMMLRQEINDAPKWVSRAKESL